MPRMNSLYHSSRLAALALMTALSLPIAANAMAPDDRDVVHDQRGNVVVNRFGNCVRTKWMGNGDECAPGFVAMVQQRQQPRHHMDIAQEERTLYFGFDKAVLTSDDTRKLDMLAANIKGDQDVKEARIVGYADRIGSTTYNDRLSQRRAKTVQDYLTGKGVINTRVTETRWLGESAPVTQCPDNLKRPDLITCLGKDRRVEVEVDYRPEQVR